MKITYETKALTLQINQKLLCQELNWQIKPGEIWGVLGANGSGKTTLLHTLAGLSTPTTGELWLEEDRLSTLSTKNIARKLGILLQDTQFIFPQTVAEYCLAGRHPHLDYFTHESADDQHIMDTALSTMELMPLAQQNVFTLSGGERRRLAIATLLTQTPALYLLDEPTNHLDLRHQIKTINHFKHLAENNSASIIMTLHDVNLAQQFCHKILMLFGDGETLQGTTAEILTSKNLSRLYQHALESKVFGNKTFWVPEYQVSLENIS